MNSRNLTCTHVLPPLYASVYLRAYVLRLPDSNGGANHRLAESRALGLVPQDRELLAKRQILGSLDRIFRVWPS